MLPAVKMELAENLIEAKGKSGKGISTPKPLPDNSWAGEGRF
jgi:hypothetical protein